MQVYNLVGAEHSHTLISMENLPSTFSDQGWGKEEELQVELMQACLKLLGAKPSIYADEDGEPLHPRTAIKDGGSRWRSCKSK